MIKKRRAFIVGIKSFQLSKNEIDFLKKYKPWGVILFLRNIKSIKQTKSLTDNIRKIFKDRNYPILIDQEGGRVNRLGKIIDFSIFTGEFFGNLFIKNLNKFKSYYTIFINQTSYILNFIGVNINTMPILDLRYKKTNKVISDRSFGSNPNIVSKIGDFCINKLHSNKIGSVIKHIPGHGLSNKDSHKSTPTVTAKKKYLYSKDFITFKNKKSFFAMTAHIIYADIDKNFTATHSKKVIDLIRNKIKFKNIIITDDISMKSLKYSIKENTTKAFNAGCNIVLHCNGNYSEMLKVAENSPKLDRFLIKKTSQFYKILS